MSYECYVVLMVVVGFAALVLIFWNVFEWYIQKNQKIRCGKMKIAGLLLVVNGIMIDMFSPRFAQHYNIYPLSKTFAVLCLSCTVMGIIVIAVGVVILLAGCCLESTNNEAT